LAYLSLRVTLCHFGIWRFFGTFCHFLALIGTRILLTALFFSDMVKIGSPAGTSLLFFRRSFMKKIIAVFAALAVFSTTLFAAPGSVSKSMSDSFDGQAKAISMTVEPVKTNAAANSKETGIIKSLDQSKAFGNLNEADDLFASVQATQLTNSEAAQVEGDGFWLVVAIVIGALAIGTCNPPPLY
jgi:hypothetical protein